MYTMAPPGGATTAVAAEVVAARAMRIGIGLPTRLGGVDPAIVLEWAARADAGPFSCLAVTDRVVIDAQEPLVALVAAIGVSSRIRLVTSVVIGPTRETTLLARQAASIDALSGGRLTLGLGIGVRGDDYEATGSSFRTRGRDFDTQLATLRGIWAGRALRDEVGAIGPAPATRGGPELLIGGYVDRVAHRIAAWGDGYMAPGGGEPARLNALWKRIGDAWTDAGRAGRPRWVGAAYFALGPHAIEAAAAYIGQAYAFDPALGARRLGGIPTSPDAVRATVRGHAAMGADELILRPCAADLDQLARLAELVGADASSP